MKDFVDDPIAGSPPRDITRAAYTYDDLGRRITETDALGRTRRHTYDDADRVTRTILEGYLPPGGGPARDWVEAERTYDADGNVTAETTGDGQRHVTDTWDEAGRLATVTLDPQGLGRSTAYTYDAAGRPTVETTADTTGTVQTRTTYDLGGRPVAATVENGASDLTTSYGYDQAGNRIWAVDARGDEPGADPADYRTTFAYDVLGPWLHGYSIARIQRKHLASPVAVTTSLR